MDIVKIEKLDDMLKYKHDWIELETIDNQATFYQSFEYNYLWAKYNLSSSGKLCIYIVINNNEVVAIAPFFIQTRKKAFITWKELKFMGMGDYRTILCDDRQVNRNTLYNLILTQVLDLEDVDRILLSYISDNNDLLNYLLSTESYNKYTKHLTENPIIDINAEDKISPSKANKKRNKVRKELNYKFSVETKVSNKLFEEFTNLHKAQQAWMKQELNRSERRSHFNDKVINKFIQEVSKAEDRSVIFLIRNASGELIFYRYCYSDKDTLYSWNSGYDYKYNNYNLSDVAIMEMIEYLEKSNDFNYLDLGAGGYPWKFRWTKNANILYQFDYWNNNKSLAYKLFQLRGN